MLAFLFRPIGRLIIGLLNDVMRAMGLKDKGD